MKPTDVVQAMNWEDQDLQIMARVQGATAVNITQATVNTIAVHVFDLTDNTEVSGSPESPAKANVIFDTLQTDDRWDVDSIGYNFRHLVPASMFADGGKQMLIEVNMTMTDGSVIRMAPYKVDVKNRLSS